MFAKTDRLIRILLIFLLAFAPLALGSVRPWSRAIVIITANVISIVWIARELIYPDASRAYRQKYTRLESPLPTALLIPALAIVALVAIQLKTSLIPSRTMIAGATLVSLLVLFFAVLNTNLRFEDTRSLIIATMTIGFLLAITGILHKLSGSTDLLWVHTLPPNRNPFGPYINKNHFAGLMILMIPLGTGLLLAGNEHSRTPTRTTPQRILLGFALLIMTQALILTLSRGGMLALTGALALLATVLSTLMPGQHRKRLITAAALSAVVFALWLGGRPLIERVETIFHLRDDMSFATRTEIWHRTIPLIKEHPLIGSGLGTYGSIIEQYRADTVQKRWSHAHNDHLQLAAEFGLAGFAAISALFFVFTGITARTAAARHSRRARYLAIGGLCGLLAFIAHSAGEFNFHITANAAAFSIVAAITMKSAFTTIRGPAGSRDKSNID